MKHCNKRRFERKKRRNPTAKERRALEWLDANMPQYM